MSSQKPLTYFVGNAANLNIILLLKNTANKFFVSLCIPRAWCYCVLLCHGANCTFPQSRNFCILSIFRPDIRVCNLGNSKDFHSYFSKLSTLSLRINLSETVPTRQGTAFLSLRWQQFKHDGRCNARARYIACYIF